MEMPQHQPLREHVAIVTGAGQGIGRAVARTLADHGAHLVVNDLDQSNAESTAEELRSSVTTAFHFQADVTDAPGVQAMVDWTADTFGAVHILVNNAGIQHVARVEEFPPEKWDAVIAINLSSAFHLIRAALPGMRRRKSGRIAAIASAHGLSASPFKCAYVAAKHGMLGLVKTVALEVAEENITCNAVCPGYVLTPLVESQIAATAKTRGISRESVKRDVMLARQPAKRFVSVAEVAAMVVYLCGDSAASVTGAALSMDGGWTAL